MHDMLVKLYDLPDPAELYQRIESQGIILRRPGVYETHLLLNWIARHFSPKWVSETQAALTRRPPACFIATENQQILGFACYDTTARGYFGPTGVSQTARGQGVGKALLFKALEALAELGHGYAIIGGVGPAEYYQKACGATLIEGSNPGIYRDILPEPTFPDPIAPTD